MADGDGSGLLWLCAIGLGLWAWNSHEKLEKERVERIDAIASADDQIQRLTIRVTQLEQEVKFTEGDLKSVVNAHESLRKTFNSNVDIENRAKVARMTAQGACGTETVRYDDGGWSVRNKECTLKDLK